MRETLKTVERWNSDIEQKQPRHVFCPCSGSDPMTTGEVTFPKYFSADCLAIHSSSFPHVLTTHWSQRFELIASGHYASRGGLYRGALVPDYSHAYYTFILSAGFRQLPRYWGTTYTGPRLAPASYPSSSICGPSIPAHRTCTLVVWQ
jgi:hypothetical protein